MGGFSTIASASCAVLVQRLFRINVRSLPVVGAIPRSWLLPADAVAGWGLHHRKERSFPREHPNQTSIFMRKRDTLRVAPGIQSDRVLRPITGVIAPPQETLPVQPFQRPPRFLACREPAQWAETAAK
jgi:hypothetical protein